MGGWRLMDGWMNPFTFWLELDFFRNYEMGKDQCRRCWNCWCRLVERRSLAGGSIFQKLQIQNASSKNVTRARNLFLGLIIKPPNLHSQRFCDERTKASSSFLALSMHAVKHIHSTNDYNTNWIKLKMAKGIRSKAKKANRTEFRRTFGQVRTFAPPSIMGYRMYYYAGGWDEFSGHSSFAGCSSNDFTPW